MKAPAEPAPPLVVAAQELAAHHRITQGPPGQIPVLASGAAARRWLERVRRHCVDPPPHASKAAEWLLDNDYQVHRALQQIDKDLPPSFYDQLPVVVGHAANQPRVFALAHEFLRAGYLQISLASAVQFVCAYQQEQPLKIAELWAFPTMLRIACVEILIASLTPLLEGQVEMPFPLSAEAGESLSLDPTERVARAISNLAIVAAVPWESFFDQTSEVEKALADDPSGHYPQMDFETRDRYRNAVEQLARAGTADESAITSAALSLAFEGSADDVRRHVGYWLVGAGRQQLETEVGAFVPLAQRPRRLILAHPGGFYAAALVLSFIISLVLPALYLAFAGADMAGWVAAMAVSIVPASVLAITGVHWAITRILPPRVLPKLDFRKGLPPEARTFVVLPVLIRSAEEIAELAAQLETHWLANVDPHLQVALLADLADAPQKVMADDKALEVALIDTVRALNKRHKKAGAGPFHLLMRPRQFNHGEGCWMGWERKRGKLQQFNTLLVHGDWSAFSIHEGTVGALHKVRYVVTVDADTLLPPGSVARLVGTLAHPLNRAVIDRATGRVTSGYTLVQPRVEISPHAGMRSLFARLFTGETAIDIYSRAVSDVYQDLFGDGIFVGKGIYDVHAFHASVEGRAPDNRILSHDLFEGAHGRAALATDIVLYEGFPASYPEYARRLHRWIRGDWQLLAWLWPRVPAADGARLRNAISAIDRWKIFDNLRRSLVAPGLLLLALAGWFVLPGSPWFWTALVVLAPGWQLFTDVISGLARGRRSGATYGLMGRFLDQAGRWFLAMVYLMHEALLSMAAISVTLWRNFVSHRHLLQWTSAAHVAAHFGQRSARAAVWRDMWLGSLIAALVCAMLAWLRPMALISAGPLLGVWILAPEIALWSGRPRRSPVVPLGDGDEIYLRLLARKTWYFFESFAGPEDNWLPPDNYQGPPHEEIGHRTSPTNIGMLLLSTAAAWDMGHVGRMELAARGANVLGAMDRLERYRGHFYNWYETHHLRPLEPRYVSTVDSGNLAVSLIAYAETLREAASHDRLEQQRWAGLGDLLALVKEAAGQMGTGGPLQSSIEQVQARIPAIVTGAEEQPLMHWVHSSALPSLEDAAARIVEETGDAAPEAVRDLFVWIDRLRHHCNEMARDLAADADPAEEMLALARQAVTLAWSMDFSWLYDQERSLFFIGHNVTTSRIDTHHYDLLASEARLASFFAIAKGDVPMEHWFHLERPVTRVRGGLSLISWNGSMFEYLMPRLLLKGEPETLLGESERVAVEIQRRYGLRHAIPWGVSESAYAERDPEHRYRYQAFGTPGLGLKRGLARDQVVAPYASALALMVAPGHATANLRQLSLMGAERRFGLWEALDFTPDRAPASGGFTPVIAYMAHHQGMVLCSIANLLTNDLMVERFGRDPQMRLVSLLLSERVPHEIGSEITRMEALPPAAAGHGPGDIRAWAPAPTPFPQVLVLGNGRMSSVISEAGGGGLRWHGQALTRFAPDATLDQEGMWLYVQDMDNGATWSATRQPTGHRAQEYNATFQPHLAEFHRRDNGIDLRMEVCVGSGDDLEIRRITLVNESSQRRNLRLTSYAEVVLALPQEDERHPAFSKLFVGGEFVPRIGGLLFTRRPRHSRETPAVMVQFVVGSEGVVAGIAHDVDRRQFIGRGRTLRGPAGASQRLTGSAGWTLDPVSALQCEITLQPGEQHVLCIVTAAAASRSAALEIATRHATLPSLQWVIDDAALETARAISRFRLAPDILPAIQSLGSVLVHPHAALRAAPTQIRDNALGQSGLWGLALSGDLPILLLKVGEGEDTLVPLLSGVHQLWRRTGLAVDLVLLQTRGSTYAEPMRGELDELLRHIGARDMLGRNGGIHLIFADQIGGDQVRLLEAMAWAILDDDKGPLSQQMEGMLAPAALPPPMLPTVAPAPDEAGPVERTQGLLFENSYGGFTPDGRNYVIYLEPGQSTPAPWANVLANDRFGTLVTEAGGGFSWAINSGENRLTPWTNDQVSDPPVETLYLRDEETVEVWSVTPQPAGQDAPCRIRHAAGQTTWDKISRGIRQEQTVFVDVVDPVKIIRLRLTNLTGRNRRLTATYYAQWLLGSLPSIARRHVRSNFDGAAQTIFASSAWNADFAARTAFLTADIDAHGVTCNREEFLGREGQAAHPAALARWGLSGAQSAGADACAAYQVHLDLAPGETQEVTFILGQGDDGSHARALAAKWRAAGMAAPALIAIGSQWDDILGTVSVQSPDAAFDLMINRWLIYQSLSSRVMARSGFYQASGAIGFRDQLQDVLALLPFDPARARAHLLVCAGHQFEEGDVLHWWHPPTDRGVRTRFSDDLLWLPYAVGTYVAATGDAAILEETIPFLSAPPLSPDEHDRYARFDAAPSGATLLDHCERALERVACGQNGLPLMGTGDWNDGMDRVGDAGRGESVWLAWFASVCADLLAGLERQSGRLREADFWSEKAAFLLRNAETAGWDGGWYRRAYDDGGHPLGSASEAECRIDSISQSWAAFAGADTARVDMALAAARSELIDAEASLARLLWPPFDKGPIDPGYIKAYPPGLRENGGQYSHAAAWLGLALAGRGHGEAALDIFHMICPARRTASRQGADLYRIEPYVTAGDIASAPPHRGKGGWSWYTGAAAWTWRLGVEGLLGLELRAGALHIAPAIPASWPGYSATYRRGNAAIQLTVERSAKAGETRIMVDGQQISGDCVEFPGDGVIRNVRVILAALANKPEKEAT
ncbi:cellobiose phosphorylase [Altererythrobacter confluentis]|uniref:Cellobiose phosphorylase n=1 Tax=Allopontixanthobacter confluentis TaxID=1849021 RepID=A0A6L7GB75_9SPHN|nr:cellobiose phosphorylase [Allopontixanthobacter confluentis]